MTNSHLPDGPDREASIALIASTWPHAVAAGTDGAVFFSLDSSNWPNFATIVWTDAFDMGNPSDLARPGVYRLNIGLGRATYAKLVGSMQEPDYRALDRVQPHPVNARQHWVAILNPSHATMRETAIPLLTEAHDRLAAVHARPASAPLASDI
jgi:hypothetical protein